jgi:hypothetical protein
MMRAEPLSASTRPGAGLAEIFGVTLLMGASFLLLFWAFPPLWMRDILAGAPLAAGGACIFLKKTQSKLAGLMFITGVVAVFNQLFWLNYVQVFDFEKPLLVAVLCGLPAGAWFVSRVFGSEQPPPPAPIARRLLGFACVAYMTGGYAYGLFALANEQLDRGRPSVESVAIHAMYGSARGPGRYRIAVADASGRSELRVRSSVYRRLKVGGTACVLLHPGALTARWREVETCSDQPLEALHGQ